MTELVAMLRAVEERVQRGWCKGRYARDTEGKEVAPSDPRACQWCLLGAVFAEQPGGSDDVEDALLRELLVLAEERGWIVTGVGIVDYNDDHLDQELALLVVRRAIETAERVLPRISNESLGRGSTRRAEDA